ncbi:hypothetical protein HHL19_35360 [Streptomyces sp. R302]|uniref:hypothetical protein n=1 Tax=unclassified Streptomyces TaxID=2593676 RepID=UPI00145D6336|nr:MULTISPECIES: hypothetical protein [unclassified Streptomyces]NML55180.1 hypothetical protein [Streptomyces sp. R301]NML83790.1 hypothetical protein [Streptomyces sp. R302]
MNALTLADADPVSTVLAWLQEHPEAAEALGGPGRVSGIQEAPWPHLRVSPGAGGDLRDLRWGITPEVTLEAYGDPGGWPGQAELRRILLRCATATLELAEQPRRPGRPVVSDVRPSGLLLWSPLVDGQPRWLMNLAVTLHP